MTVCSHTVVNNSVGPADSAHSAAVLTAFPGGAACFVVEECKKSLHVFLTNVTDLQSAADMHIMLCAFCISHVLARQR